LLWQLMNPKTGTPAPGAGSPEPPVVEPASGAASDADAAPAGALAPLAVIGLGNPDPEYVGTRHNVGRALVDMLAQRLQAEWTRTDDAFVAWTRWRGLSLCLVKPTAFMNHTGPVLKRVFAELDLVPRRAMLLHDEVKLEPGRVRARIEGGDGGHLGVRSILHAFEDNRFRRVKVGVGLPPPGRTLSDHVLAPFRTDERETVERAMQQALEQTVLFLDEMAERARAELQAAPGVDQAGGQR
jgi:PTH1 family peptidyl-tRNA hydrolase